MKRERFSPTIDNNNDRSTDPRFGISKKLAAFLLTASMATGLAACKDGETTSPNLDSDTSSSKTNETEVVRTDGITFVTDKITGVIYPDAEISLSPQALEDEERYLNFNSPEDESFSIYHQSVDFDYIEPSTNRVTSYYDVELADLKSPLTQTDKDGNLNIHDASNYPAPNLENYADRSQKVFVNETEYDVDKMYDDPYYLSVIAAPESVKYELHGQLRTAMQAVSAMGLSEGGVISEVLAAKLVDKTTESPDIVLGREYQLLDENATDEEILTNFNIETAAITSVSDEEGKYYAGRGYANYNTGNVELSADLLSSLKSTGKDTVLKAYVPWVEDGLDITTGNKSLQYYSLTGYNTFGTEPVEQVRVIYAKDLLDTTSGNSTPMTLTFFYVRAGNFGKWVLESEYETPSSLWSYRKDELYREQYAQDITVK